MHTVKKNQKQEDKLPSKKEPQEGSLSPEKEKKLKTTIEDLCDQLKQHISANNTKSTLQNVKDIQAKWENIKNGKIKDSYSVIFKKLFREYFSKLKSVQQKENWERWENYTNKHLLCEQIENLLNEQDFYKVSKEIKVIWEKWREIGPIPKEQNNIIWERFNTTRKELNHRCKDFFNNLRQEKIKNLEIKTQLCEEAEAIKDSDDWETTAKIFKDIQQKWKETGKAPRPQDDELFTRLRTAANLFFQKRSTSYAKLHTRQSAHKTKKKELCKRAEELVKLQWESAFREIKELRRQWHNTPPASKKDEQFLWEKFNDSINNFVKKNDNERPENLKKNKALCKKSKTLLSILEANVDPEKLKKSIDELLVQWKEVGPVPIDKEKELKTESNDIQNKLKALYREQCNSLKAEARKTLFEKEKLIAQIEKIALLPDNSAQITEIKKQWKLLSSDVSIEKHLDKRFDDVCNAVRNQQTTSLNNLENEHQDNLQAKIKLCIQLEKLAGAPSSEDIFNTERSISLADEIKLSIENNFAAKKSMTKEELYSKYQKLKKEWDEIGPIPIDHYERICSRYDQACSAIEQKYEKNI